ncbi:lipoprotein [Spiroplasma endosymbiont of Polydrusus cervinus]
MKKLLSILGAVGLTATSTTSLISCEKPVNCKFQIIKS